MTEKYDESPIFERCAPEEQGISSRHIASFLNRLDRCGYNLHSLQLFRNGKVLYAAAAAPFTLTCPHRMFSAAKAVISLSVLFAIQEKKLRFEDPVIRYFRDVLPAAPSALLEKMTVYDLLTMQTGMEKDPFPLLFQDEDADLIRPFFQTEVEHAPGSGFKYNNTVPHILYTLTERAVGEPFEQYQQSRLCDPLRIRITVQYNKNGGYNPLTTVMSNEALLRIGVLYTRGGRWQGKQLLDEALVRYATSYHVPTQKNRRTWQEESGYGMQVMRNSYGGFRLPGGFGQFAICLPEDDLTVSIMSADERIAPPLDAFREEIYANMQKKPLPPDPAAEKELADATERFNLAARIQAPVPSALDFPLGKEIRFLRNSFGLESLLVEQQDLRGKQGIPLRSEAAVAGKRRPLPDPGGSLPPQQDLRGQSIRLPHVRRMGRRFFPSAPPAVPQRNESVPGPPPLERFPFDAGTVQKRSSGQS